MSVSLRKGTGQPVCQGKRQDLLLLQCQKLQEQQVTRIRIHKRYPESNRKNCPCHKQKGEAKDKLTRCSNLPPDYKMDHIDRRWEQTLGKTGLPQVHLINLQQLRLVSFKLCQCCAAHPANTEPFQEPAKPLQTSAVHSQGCVRTVRRSMYARETSPCPRQADFQCETGTTIHKQNLCVRSRSTPTLTPCASLQTLHLGEARQERGSPLIRRRKKSPTN